MGQSKKLSGGVRSSRRVIPSTRYKGLKSQWLPVAPGRAMRPALAGRLCAAIERAWRHANKSVILEAPLAPKVGYAVICLLIIVNGRARICIQPIIELADVIANLIAPRRGISFDCHVTCDYLLQVKGAASRENLAPTAGQQYQQYSLFGPLTTRQSIPLSPQDDWWLTHFASGRGSFAYF